MQRMGIFFNLQYIIIGKRIQTNEQSLVLEDQRIKTTRNDIRYVGGGK